MDQFLEVRLTRTRVIIVIAIIIVLAVALLTLELGDPFVGLMGGWGGVTATSQTRLGDVQVHFDLIGPYGLSGPRIRWKRITAWIDANEFIDERICFVELLLTTYPLAEKGEYDLTFANVLEVPIPPDIGCVDRLDSGGSLLDISNPDSRDSSWTTFQPGNFATFFPIDGFTTWLTAPIHYRLSSPGKPSTDGFLFPSLLLTKEGSGYWRISGEYEEVESVIPLEHIMLADYPPNSLKLLSLKFSRPMHILALAFLMPVVVMLMIVGTGRLASLSRQLEIAAALMFGLFGLREILTPNDIQSGTLLDLFIVIDYLILSVVITYSLSRIVLLDLRLRRYAASKFADIFHRSDCPYVKRIADKNLIHFDTKGQASRSGLTLCTSCSERRPLSRFQRAFRGRWSLRRRRVGIREQ